MGQYFYPYLEQGNRRTVTTPAFYAYETDRWHKKGDQVWCGLKITEHSWLGNTFMTAYAKKLYNKAGRLIWIGDYADNKVITSADGAKTPAPIQKLRNDEKNATYNVENVECIYRVRKPFDISNKYIINLSRKEYLDMKAYCKRSADFTYCDKDDPTPWVLHPLSLLTATYNGGNGGDYHSNHPSHDQVGRWKYDRIIIKDYLPKYAKNYNELIVTFNEHINVPIQGVA